MQKRIAAVLSAGAFVLATAAPAGAAPNDNACADGHGTHVAHETVPHANAQAHASIPHFCHDE